MTLSKHRAGRWIGSVAVAGALMLGLSACDNSIEDEFDQQEEELDEQLDQQEEELEDEIEEEFDN